MKIVHVNTYENFGGAGIAGQRLVHAINELELGTATILSASTTESGGNFFHRGRFPELLTKFSFAADTAWVSLNAEKPQYRFAFSPAVFGRDISTWKRIIEADIIHLHWINQGFISISNLRRLIALGKPIVWTLHDMWSFTGGCHYSGICDHFKGKCGNCFFLKNPHGEDLSHIGWLKKEHIYAEAKNITFIACSNWLAGVARSSSLLKSARINAIPNPIDTALFCPLDKSELRKKWRISPDVKLILFGAANISEKRKGLVYLIAALQLLKDLNKNAAIEVAVFGKNKSFSLDSIPFPAHNLSVITSQKDMSEIYGMADVFVLPSLEDNLPNTVMESMACGTPAVAFNIGGLPDLIEHQKDGYLAEYSSSADLALGIEWIFSNPDLAINARQKVIEKFSNGVIARQYMNLYKSVLHDEG